MAEVPRSRHSLESGQHVNIHAVQFIQTSAIQHLLELHSIALLLMEEGEGSLAWGRIRTQVYKPKAGLNLRLICVVWFQG